SGDQADGARGAIDPVGEPEPGRAEASDYAVGKYHEDFVALHRMDELNLREALQPLSETRGHRIGMAREIKPAISLEIGLELGGDEAHLGEELTRALAPDQEHFGQGEVEEYDDLRAQRAILGGAEREHIDTGTPGDFRRSDAQMRDRIGEA